MSKTVRPNLPDEVRLKMIEKSEFYSEPQVYQYGFYDGFQHAQYKTQELQEQNAELVSALQSIVNLQDKYFGEKDIHRVLQKRAFEIEDLLTKYKHLKKKS